MLTRDYIENHIRQTKYPCWALFVVQNYKRIPLYFYNGEDFEEGDTADSKSEKAVNRLQLILHDYPADARLSIDLKSSKGANGTQGTIGPLEFTNRDKGDELATPTAPQQGFGGFGGFVQPPAGWVSEETLNGKLEAMKAENERLVNNILFKHKEDAFKEQCRRERRELEEMRKELQDERKKYESNTGAAAETLVYAVKKILGELFPQLPFGQAAATTPSAQPQLAGAAAEPMQNNVDPKYRAVEILANSLYENPNLTEKDINEIAQAISQRSKAKEQQPAPSAPSETATQPTVVNFYTGEEDSYENV